MRCLCTIILLVTPSLLVSCSGGDTPRQLDVQDLGPVQVKKQRPWYHSGTLYAKDLTDQQAQKKVSQIMREFTMPEEAWDNCLTFQDFLIKANPRPPEVSEIDYMSKIRDRVESFYPSLQGPPAYLKEIRIPGLRYSGRVKPWKRLTRKEKLMLKRFYPFRVLPEDELKYWENDILLTVFSALIRNWWGNRNEVTISRVDQLFIDFFDMRFMLDPRRRLKGKDWEEWVQSWMYEYTSPITGKIFEPWHEEFSPGNGYFRLLTDSYVVSQLRDSLPDDDKTNFPRADTYFMYYRIYGERSVIAEGFYAAYIGMKPIERESERERIEMGKIEKLF